MEVRAGYKQTEVGVLPENWECSKFTAVTDLITCGIAATPKYVSESQGYPFLSSTNVKDGCIVWDNYKWIGKDLHMQLYRNNPPLRGDILYSRVGTIGEAAVVDVDFEFSVYVSLTLIKPKKSLDSSFLKHLLNSYGYKRRAKEQVYLGGGVGNLNVAVVRDYPIVVPPFPEQRAIATTLSDVDALLTAQDKLIAKKRDIKQAAMQLLLTGKQRLPGFSGEWEMKPLGEIAHIKTGSRNNQDKVEDGEYPFFVRSATVERINSYSHDCEAILIPGEGGIGSIFHYINGRFDVHQRVYAITQFSPEVSGKFVYLFMTQKFGAHAMQNSVKATVDSLRLPTFQNFEVALPPTIDEQIAIANVLTDMDAELTALEQQRDKTRALKQGMMQELLTGRIRLV